MQGFQPARLPEPTGEPGTELVEPTRMMQVIGERMTEAQQHIPHFYATVEVRMDAAMALRKQLNEQLEEEGIKLSVNDFVMKACAVRSEEHTSELQSRQYLVCRLLLEKKRHAQPRRRDH